MIKDPQALIVGKKNWEDYYLFSLESSGIASQALPGQFIMVRISAQPQPLLRRPFSIHSKEKKNIEIFFQITGLGTSLLSQKRIGESLDILGPLGKGFVTGESFQDKVIVAVGGGRGIAPLYFLSQELCSSGASVKIFYGGKSHKDLPLKEKFEKDGIELFCSTDDGSFGYKGFVSDFFKAELEKLNPSCVFACGPEEMMKKIAQITQEKNIPAEFSLESVMGCGFGACWGCVKKIKKNFKEEWTKICEEGPVFSREEIIWTEEEK
ncbi:MAG: dihydroorotate dehydrogenase electron transfer subunit [Candidatus Aminicenantes bacterium]|nr:dihydroorotate dehydrogenase electron transfer subunit [Candidatus Aminicenantes bacterium]